MLRCLRCGGLVDASSYTCPACGGAAIVCPACGTSNRARANFCDGCGRPLPVRTSDDTGAPTPGQPSSASTTVEAQAFSAGNFTHERKTITVMFADIRQSTKLVDGLDPEEAMAFLAPALDAMVGAVQRFGGTISRVSGDGILALFGAPVAYEDHALRACLAGLSVCEVVRSATKGEIEVRVGLHSGEVVLRSIRSDLFTTYEGAGPTVHVAARMEQLAEPGTVRLTESTYQLVRGFVSVRPLGTSAVRGVQKPVAQFEVQGEVATPTRWQIRAQFGLTQFVGRQSEFARVGQAVRHVAAGVGQTVAVVGEPGVGKSRLLHELISMPELEGWTVHATGAMSYEGNATYLPVARLLQAWLDLAPCASQEENHRKVADQLRLPRASHPYMLSAVCSVLGLPFDEPSWRAMEPAQRRQQIIDSLVQLFLEEARDGPVLFVFEDLHWIDAGTYAVLAALAAQLSSERLLLAVSYRPDFDPGGMRDDIATVIEVEPLDQHAANALLDHLIGDAPSLRPLKELLIAETDGTPLFLEEIVQTLIAIGTLHGTAEGYRLTEPVKEIELPRTVQAVLAARVDSLSTRHKDVLQRAAVIGQEPARGLLRAISDLADDEFESILAELESNRLLVRGRPQAPAGHAFKHVLTREVVYDGIPRGRRRALHAAVLGAMEAQYAGGVYERPEVLAGHAMRGELWEKAVGYLSQAASRSMERSAYREGVAYLEQELECLERLPGGADPARRGIDARIGLRRALFALGEFKPIHGHLLEARRLAESIDDPPRLAAVSTFEANILSHGGTVGEAIDIGLRARDIASRVGDRALLLTSNIVLSLAFEFGGDAREVVAALRPLVGSLEEDTGAEPFATTATYAVQCLSILAGGHACLGEFKQAVRDAHRARDIAAESRRPHDVGLANYYHGCVLIAMGELDEAIAILRDGLSLPPGFNTPWLESRLGYAYVAKGRTDEGGEWLERSFDRARSMGLAALEMRAKAWLAATAFRTGDQPRAAELARAAQEMCRARGYRALAAWLLRLDATMDLGRGHASILQRAARKVEAALEIDEALGLLPSQADGLSLLGAIRERAGQSEKAAAAFAEEMRAYAVMGITRERASRARVVTIEGARNLVTTCRDRGLSRHRRR